MTQFRLYYIKYCSHQYSEQSTLTSMQFPRNKTCWKRNKSISSIIVPQHFYDKHPVFIDDVRIRLILFLEWTIMAYILPTTTIIYCLFTIHSTFSLELRLFRVEKEIASIRIEEKTKDVMLFNFNLPHIVTFLAFLQMPRQGSIIYLKVSPIRAMIYPDRNEKYL